MFSSRIDSCIRNNKIFFILKSFYSLSQYPQLGYIYINIYHYQKSTQFLLYCRHSRSLSSPASKSDASGGSGVGASLMQIIAQKKLQREKERQSSAERQEVFQIQPRKKEFRTFKGLTLDELLTKLIQVTRCWVLSLSVVF